MKRFIAICVAVFVAGTGVASAAPARATFTKHRYTAKDAHFTRNYWVYKPARLPRSPSLVVFLHGCVSEDAARDAAKATKWNQLAAKKHLIVVYPEQRIDQTADGASSSNGNGLGCWNWFQPVNQTRGSGEAATIAGITRRVAVAYHADRRRIFLAGPSAGAAQAVNMAAAYPDLYASIAVLAGCAYSSCGDGSGELAFEQMGPRKRVVPVLAVQSVTDNLNNVAMGTSVVSQWLGTDDLADNGTMDGSISRTPASVTHHGLDTSVVGGVGTVGDTCVRLHQWPCPGALFGWKSYPYSVAKYTDAKHHVVIESWTIYGAFHAYTGGDPKGQFTDPIGPDLTAASYRFFTAHPKR